MSQITNSVGNAYLDRIIELAADVQGLNWSADIFRQSSVTTSRALYCCQNQVIQLQDPDTLLQAVSTGINEGKDIVCVVENVGPTWMSALGQAWDIDPQFFLNHATNPSKDRTWDAIFSTRRDLLHDDQAFHIDGVIEFQDWHATSVDYSHLTNNFIKRHFWAGPEPYPLSSNTRVSYLRPRHDLYLILVDAPVNTFRLGPPRRHRPRPILRLPCSTSRGGLHVPALFEDTKKCLNLFDSFGSMLSHGWHWNVLFSRHLLAEHDPGNVALRPSILMYLMSMSLWDTNLRFLHAEIKRISFNDLLEPSKNINNELHYNRQDLVILRDVISETKDYVPDSVIDWLKMVERERATRTPIETYIRLLQDEEKLSQFLMDSFQLLLSTLSIRDTQISLEQATRGARLTQLAFIYIPLSFVTGIFGMNLKEINGATLSVWVMLVTAVVVVVCTLLTFGGLRIHEDWQVRKLTSRSTKGQSTRLNRPGGIKSSLLDIFRRKEEMV